MLHMKKKCVMVKVSTHKGELIMSNTVKQNTTAPVKPKKKVNLIAPLSVWVAVIIVSNVVPQFLFGDMFSIGRSLFASGFNMVVYAVTVWVIIAVIRRVSAYSVEKLIASEKLRRSFNAAAKANKYFK